MTADLGWEFTGLDFGLGRPTDRPIDRWAEAFLPGELHDLLRDTRVADAAGSRPLVKSERVVYTSTRPPPPARPPGRYGGFAIAGMIAGGALFGLGALATRNRIARVAFGTTTALVGLVFGFLGAMLVFLWAVTDHRAAHANENMLACGPWLLALVVFGVGVARGSSRAARRALFVAAFAAAATALGMTAKALPGNDQDNWRMLLFFFPVWAGLALGMWRAQPPRQNPSR